MILAVSYAAGWKAWPRGLRPLRCSLDSARNDGYDTGNLFMKRAAIFYWLVGIAIAAIAIGAAFYLDDTVWRFIMQYQNRTLRSFMHNVSRFGDWPSHVALGHGACRWIISRDASAKRGSSRSISGKLHVPAT